MINYEMFQIFICYIVALNGRMVDCMYLAKTTGSSISTSSTYIVFLTKLQKRQIPENGISLGYSKDPSPPLQDRLYPSLPLQHVLLPLSYS